MALNSSLVLTALTTYVDQIGINEIVMQSIFNYGLRKHCRVQRGIKGTQAINVETSLPIFKPADCSLFSPAGTVTYTQVNITVQDIIQEENICQIGAGSIEKYFFGVLAKGGMRQEELTPDLFAKAFIDDKVMKRTDYLNKLAWQGVFTGTHSFSSTIPNMDQADGWLYALNYGPVSGSVVTCTASGGVALTSANAVSVIQAMIALIPQEILDKPMLFCAMNTANYITVTNALIDLKQLNPAFWVNINGDSTDEFGFIWPYLRNLHVYADGGLQGRNDIILSFPENFVVGTDLESEFETFEVRYEPLYKSIMFDAMFRFGTAVIQGQYVVACLAAPVI
jgi:hypothetical protein